MQIGDTVWTIRIGMEDTEATPRLIRAIHSGYYYVEGINHGFDKYELYYSKAKANLARIQKIYSNIQGAIEDLQNTVNRTEEILQEVMIEILAENNGEE